MERTSRVSRHKANRCEPDREPAREPAHEPAREPEREPAREPDREPASALMGAKQQFFAQKLEYRSFR